jgi:hypothetical protein
MSVSSDPLSAILGIVAVVSAATCSEMFVLPHLFPTEYDPIKNAVRDCGVGPCGDWFRDDEVDPRGKMALTLRSPPRNGFALIFTMGIGRKLIASGRKRRQTGNHDRRNNYDPDPPTS